MVSFAFLSILKPYCSNIHVPWAVYYKMNGK